MGWGRMKMLVDASAEMTPAEILAGFSKDGTASSMVLVQELAGPMGMRALVLETGCAPMYCSWCGNGACPGCGADPILRWGDEGPWLACRRWSCRLRFHLDKARGRI